MDINKEKRAKEIYLQYSGSKFQMMRDGIYDEYAQSQISENQEKVWLKELIHENIDKLDINNKDSLFPLWYIIMIKCEITYIDNIIDYTFANKTKSKDTNSLLTFISKIEDIIERIETSCGGSSKLLSEYKMKIGLLKNEI